MTRLNFNHKTCKSVALLYKRSHIHYTSILIAVCSLLITGVAFGFSGDRQTELEFSDVDTLFSEASASGVKTMVSDGVDDFVLVPSADKVFWSDKPECPPDTLVTLNESIARKPTYDGKTRTLFDEAVTCGSASSQIRSTIAADAGYVYWFNYTGVYRLSTNANPGDAPQLLTAAITGGSGELVADDDYLFALVDASSNPNDYIIRIDKNSGSWSLVVGTAGLTNLATDGKYVYWIEKGDLRRRLITSNGITTLASGVKAYYPEGKPKVCNGICYSLFNVYYSTGNQLWRYNSSDGSKTHIYTNAWGHTITHITGDADDLFYFLAIDPPCDPIICFHQYYLYSIGLKGGTPVLLHALGGKMSPLKLDSDGTFLFWNVDDKDADTNALQSRPNKAGSIQLTNMKVVGIEVNQGIQNQDNSVILIKNRTTVVRVLVDSSGADVPGVTAYLYGSWPGDPKWYGPLFPANKVGTHITVRHSPKVESLDDSFVFVLPWEWTTKGPLTLKVVLNPSAWPPEPNYIDNIFEEDDPFTFEPSPRLPARLFSFGYEVPAIPDTEIRPSLVEIFEAISFIRRLFPLASTPGGLNDPSSGFRPVIEFHLLDKELGSWVDQSAYGCIWSYAPAKRNLCASKRANDLMFKIRLIAPNTGIPYNDNYRWYGFISNGAGFPIRGQAKVNAFVASGSSGAVGTFAHEIGHLFFRHHPFKGSVDDTNRCGNSPANGYYDYNYPYKDSLIWWFGFPKVNGIDVGDDSLGIPISIKPGLNLDTFQPWFDIMGYCRPRWISDYTYEALYDVIKNTTWWPANVKASQSELSSAQSPAGDYLMVIGSIVPADNRAILNIVERHPTVNYVPARDQGGYSIRLVNSSGDILADYAFTPEVPEDGDGLLHDFGQVVDFVTGTAEIQIVDGRTDEILTSRPVSANKPDMSDVRFTLSDVRFTLSASVATDTGMLTWNSNDQDGDALAYDIFHSSDGGATFQPKMLGVDVTSSPIAMDELGAGPHVWRVVAIDGVNTSFADSTPYTHTAQPSQPQILSPADGNHYRWGQLVNFMGQAYDLQDGTVVASGLEWQDDNGVLLGTGPLLSLTNLPAGTNRIWLQATNSFDLTAKVSIVIHVDDDLRMPGPTLSVAPEGIYWQVAPGTTTIQTATLHIDNLGSDSINWTVEESTNWLSLSELSGTTPSSLTLTADPSGLANGDLLRSELSISWQGDRAASDPVAFATVQVQLAVGNTWVDPCPSVGARVDPSRACPSSLLYLPLVMR